jgi:hypothetical protein
MAIKVRLMCALNAFFCKHRIGHFGLHQVTAAVKHHERLMGSLQFFELRN